MFSRWVDTDGAVVEILVKRRRTPLKRALLVGVSGIDGSGKGYLTSRVVSDLQLLGWNTVSINADGWLNLPSRRFSDQRPAEHFYENALRLDDLFSQLILPLQSDRSVRLMAEFAEETATEFRPHLYEYTDVDIVVVEGILLFKEPYWDRFDLRVWVDCTFETALDRALRRGQEGLSLQEAEAVYETVYFPAQKVHMERDDPKGRADFIIENDPRLSSLDLGTLGEWADSEVAR